MYLKRSRGPAAVTLPDGRILSRSDLPNPETRRWVASRKAAVVQAVTHGLLSVEDACDVYSLSEEELDAWRHAVEEHGEKALKSTRLQAYRQLENTVLHTD
jgi:transposase-like protein